MELNDTLIDELLKGTKTPEDFLVKDGLLKQLAKRLVERMLDEELTDHLDYEKNDIAGRDSGNSHNGHTNKNILRDGDSSFQPQLIPKTKPDSRVLMKKLSHSMLEG
ncbi:hypothetical protein CMK12_02105 [Candidatus Poribacteria bacterium]|nr:hypothetical protein [Candidatus Poribacteria bacterium]